MSTIPRGGIKIAEARKQGKKPADMVIISLVGYQRDSNPIVTINPEDKYDWWFLKGLNVVVFTKKGVMWRPTVESIAKAHPKNLWLWDVENNEGADVYYLPEVESVQRDPKKWVWSLDFLPWLPFQNREFAKCN